jgi:hypothetical protein
MLESLCSRMHDTMAFEDLISLFKLALAQGGHALDGQ